MPAIQAMSGSLTDRLRRLVGAMRADLRDGILPFWLELEDATHGGHYALMDQQGRIDVTAPKPTIFVARLLWTFATAGQALKSEACLLHAQRSKRFLLDRLRDPNDGAFHWSVSHDGRPLARDKHVYAQAFAIYGLSAHAMATGDEESLNAAERLFGLLEARARQPDGSYAEAFDGEWRPIPNHRMTPRLSLWNRLARRDAARTANTHIHLIEAYESLLRAGANAAVGAALRGLLEGFLTAFVASSGTHCHAALDARLRPLHAPVSYGHDIEASWLIEAAGDALGDAALTQRLRVAASRLAAAAVRGQGADGGWIAESGGAAARTWWVQAEAVVGLVNAALRGGDPAMMERAEACWAFIERCMIDRQGGEWFHAVDASGRPDRTKYKVGPWKDPYHQVRACLYLAARLKQLEAGGDDGVIDRSPTE